MRDLDSLHFQPLKRFISDARTHVSNRIPLVRIAEPALQLSPLQQYMSHSNEPVAFLQTSLVSILHAASDAQLCLKYSSPSPLKYSLRHLSSARAGQV